MSIYYEAYLSLIPNVTSNLIIEAISQLCQDGSQTNVASILNVTLTNTERILQYLDQSWEFKLQTVTKIFFRKFDQRKIFRNSDNSQYDCFIISVACPKPVTAKL